ncbi:hypothetical protein ABZZ80_02400 [Streptomyces sp. NPDC006356]
MAAGINASIDQRIQGLIDRGVSRLYAHVSERFRSDPVWDLVRQTPDDPALQGQLAVRIGEAATSDEEFRTGLVEILDELSRVGGQSYLQQFGAAAIDNVINSPGYRSTVIDNNTISGDSNVTAGGDVNITSQADPDPRDWTAWPWPFIALGALGVILVIAGFIDLYSNASSFNAADFPAESSCSMDPGSSESISPDELERLGKEAGVCPPDGDPSPDFTLFLAGAIIIMIASALGAYFRRRPRGGPLGR